MLMKGKHYTESQSVFALLHLDVGSRRYRCNTLQRHYQTREGAPS